MEVKLKKDLSNGSTFIDSHNYIPVWRYIEKGEDKETTYRLIPISAFEQDPAYKAKVPAASWKAMSDFARRMRAHLGKYNSSERKLSLPGLFDEAEN